MDGQRRGRKSTLSDRSPKLEIDQMTLILLTTATIAIAMLIMAVGVIFSRRSLRGSCGGTQLQGPGGEPLNCDACPYRDDNPDCEKRGPASQLASGSETTETEDTVVSGTR